MPVIKSAIKKLRQDKKREKHNDDLRIALQSSVRSAKKTKSGKSVAKAMILVDKAAKHNIIHPNKASRMKSSLAKVAKPVSTKSGEKKQVPQKSTKKTPAKKASK